jgi:membrane protein
MQVLGFQLRRGERVVRRTLAEFARHRSAILAAALAFHSLVCMAPLLIVAVAIAGLVFGRGTAHAELQQLLEESVGPQLQAEIDGWVVAASKQGELASAVGVGLTLLAASKLGTQLRHILNQIGEVDADPFVPSVPAYVRRRLLAIAMTAAAGPLLLLFLLSRTLLAAFHFELLGLFPGGAWLTGLLQGVLSAVIMACACAAAYRYVPDTVVGWKQALAGGALTALLLSLANLVLGRYFAASDGAHPYEAAGFGLVLLLWLYVSTYTFLLGAELTQVLTRKG